MIPEKLDKIKQTKHEIKAVLDKTHQDTNIPFREYSNLIKNIPNTGALTQKNISDLTKLAIEISGEKA